MVVTSFANEGCRPPWWNVAEREVAAAPERRRAARVLTPPRLALRRQGLQVVPGPALPGAPPDVRLSERKAEGHPDARQTVPEAVADAEPRVLEDPQPGRLGEADADPELELIGDFERILTGERELGRREEVVVHKGAPDVGHQALDPKPERVPDFQAVLERPEALAPGLADRDGPRPGQLGADAQEEVPHRDLEEVADPRRVQGDNTLVYVQLPPWLALDGRGPVERPAEARRHIWFDRPPPPQGNLELRLGQQKHQVLRRGDLGSEHTGLEGEVTVAQVAGEH